MRSKLNRLLCFLALALPASAQLDSAQLRVKFGMPLSRVQAKSGAPGREIVNVREFFDVPPGFSLVVDYGAGNQVCKLQVAGLMPKQKMQAFLSELVPDSMRGKETGRGQGISGPFYIVSIVSYEQVTITEVAGSNTITVQFKNPACQQQAAH